MPWMETMPAQQRTQCIDDVHKGFYTMTELYARYGISRKTGDKWLERFSEDGRRGLADRSRAPHTCPHRIVDDVADRICAARRKHPIGDRRSCSTGSRRAIPTLTGRP